MSKNSANKKVTITKKDLVQSIAKDQKIQPNDARQIVQSFLDKITESLRKGERLEFREFGVFEVVQRKQKVGRNPKKADIPIIIPARSAVKFTAGKRLFSLKI